MNRSERLKRLLAPQRVVWFGGAGMTPAIKYMQAHGFSGESLFINPHRTEVAGLACVSSIAELPWVPDLAVLAIPKQAAVHSVEALNHIGCGAVICIASGFSESTDGAAQEAALIQAAGDMPVIGPNCPGIANFLDGKVFMMNHFGTHAPKRGIAVISNGGAYLSDLGCAERSQPIAYMIGLGNQAMIGIAEMLDVLLDDPRVTAVNIYFEKLGNVVALSQAAAKAAEKNIAVVAVQGGRSQTGSRAAQSHTASLTSDAAIATALFRRFGWIEVETQTEALETLKMLSFTPIPQGMKAGLVTSSGSYAVLGADIAESYGLQMETPSEPVAALLDAALPPYVSAANPLDIADAHGWTLEDQLPIYRAFVQADYDIFVQVMCYPPAGGWDMNTWEVTTEALAQAKGNRPAAFINTLAESLPQAARERMIASGIAPLQGLKDGLCAVAQVARYGTRLGQLEPSDMILKPCAAEGALGATRQQLDEVYAKNKLAAAGLDVPRHWLVDDAHSMPDIACRCALKAIIPELHHKTDAGAVALNIQPEDLAAAIKSMKTHLSALQLQAHGFFVEEMVPKPIAELLVGLRRTPAIGVVLTLALGGTTVELLHDSATLILPTPRADIEASLRALKLAPLLLGFRGRQPANLVATLDAIETLCALVQADPQIVELEINPLILTEARAVIADAVLTLTG